MDVSNRMFWRLQTQFWVWEGWRGLMFCLHFWLFCSHHLSCSQASQEFRAVLGLAESNLINSSSQQGSSSRQELLVSTTLLHSLFLALVGGSLLGMPVLRLAAFAVMPFWGASHKTRGSKSSLSSTASRWLCARGDIKAKVRWEEPDSLTYLSWILSLSRLTHRWVCSTPWLPFLSMRKPSPLTTSMQEIWASVFSLGRFIAAERLFKHRGWQRKMHSEK